MSTNDILVLLAMVLYIAFILGIGVFYKNRANSNSDEYFLGGRGLGPWVAALSAEASDMSGWLLMGLPGVAYFTGASDAIWTALGLFIGTWLNWKFVAKPLRIYSERLGAITIPDFFSARFGDKKKVLMSIAAILILVFFSIYVGSCFVTLGRLFSTVFPAFHYEWAVIAGGLFVGAYTLLGGFLAASVSDFFQGCLMIFSIVVITVTGMLQIGGFEVLGQRLSYIDGYFSLTEIATPLLGADETSQVITNGLAQYDAAGSYGIITIVSTLAWGLGYFGMPQVLLRFMAIKDPNQLKRSRRIACTWMLISISLAILAGMIGKAMFPDIGWLITASSSETVFIKMATFLLPSFVAGLVMSGILAAAMSSADSYMLAAGSSIARNFYKGLLRKDASERSIMWVSRITLTLIVIFGIIVAYDQNSVIFDVVAYAWAGFGAAFGPLMLLSLFWKRTTLPGAISGMCTGAVAIIVWRNFVKPLGGMFGIYELLPGFLLALIVIVVVSLLTKAPDAEITDEFDAYRKACKE